LTLKVPMLLALMRDVLARFEIANMKSLLTH
jgi:hypothetical protein